MNAKATTKDADDNKRGSLAFGRNLIVLAALILAPCLWCMGHGLLTLRWPRTDATIVDANFRVQTEQVASPGRDRDEWNTFSTHYRYAVAGKEYLSGRIEPYDMGMQNSAGAERMRQQYPVGSPVHVAYDPQSPDIAYLEPGPSSVSLMLGGAAVFMGLCGFWVRSLAKRGLGRMET